MKETLIFSNTNQFALSRLLAENGVNNIGYRVFNNSTIFSYIKEKTSNLTTKELINNKEKTFLYNRYLIDDQSYFKGAGYENAKGLNEIIDSIRALIVSDEEKELKDKLKGNNKYEAIYKFYKKYLDYLNKNNKTDTINEARELIKANNKIDQEIIIFKEEKIAPLTKKLLESCFKSIKEIEYRELFKVSKSKIDFKYLYKSKGYTHEVENVFKIIYDNKLSIDKCTIVYTNYNNFYNPIKEYSTLFNIPVSYIDGIHSYELNAYRMLYLITKLNDGLYGYDVLMNLIKDKSFNYDKLMKKIDVKEYLDSFFEEIGDLKFSFDKQHNDEIYSKYIKLNNDHKEEIKRFKDIFNKGLINLIEEYVINDDAFNTNSLINLLELHKSIIGYYDFDFYKSILNTNLNTTMAKEGTLTVCSIAKAKENIRENMFFIGNDSDSFHISLAENSFVFDDKLMEFDKENAKTSINKAINKREEYSNLIQLAFDLGSNVYVSYTEKDESELKEHNFISILYDLQVSSHPEITFKEFKNSFVSINSYFGNNFNKNEKIIENYLDKTKSILKQEQKEEKEDKIDNLLDRRYSPTQIELNINCKKRFLIERVLGVNGEEDYDVFDKLANTDLGSMFHEVMEFANTKASEQEVINKAKEVFEKYRAKRNPVLDYELERDKEDFLDIVHNGYEYLKKKEKGTAEQKQTSDININGNTLHLKGFPDLVSGNEIIDYKAKRTITHKEDDIVSCIQALIYALMNSDKNIDHVEYYYPIYNKTIKTTYNENNVKGLLGQFIDSLVNNDFKAAKDILVNDGDEEKLDDICKYCDFKDICGREE